MTLERAFARAELVGRGRNSAVEVTVAEPAGGQAGAILSPQEAKRLAGRIMLLAERAEDDAFNARQLALPLREHDSDVDIFDP